MFLFFFFFVTWILSYSEVAGKSAPHVKSGGGSSERFFFFFFWIFFFFATKVICLLHKWVQRGVKGLYALFR